MRRGRVAAVAAACVLIAGAPVFAISGGGDSSSSDGASLARSGGVARAQGSAASAKSVTVSPLPGARDASPGSQISFLGVPGTQVARVRIVGSLSGAHTGRLEAYSTGTGASFLPSRPFVQGERVTVHALVGTGTPAHAASTSFQIARQATFTHKEFPTNPGSSRDIQHYSSAPSLTPSTVRITTPARPGATPGDFLLAPYQGAGTPGPMIVDQAGNLVWFHPAPAHDEATNLQVEQYDGKPVLVWWQGRILQVGFGQGDDVVYNTSYQPVAVIRAGNGYQADLHEIRLTPQGTAWIDAFDPVHMNLSSAHGPSDGVVSDSVIQEIDIKTGLVMWEWHALDHIALAESHNPITPGFPWDYIHINSVDPGPSGDVMLSARNSWTVYDVDLHSGGFRWRLGDQHSSFRLGPGTRFYWQHDAEFQPGGLISLFDNGSDPPKEKQSRGLLLAPSAATHRVTLVRQYTNPSTTLLAESQGNMLSLPGGNWLLGYGRLPNFTEFSATGHVLFDATRAKRAELQNLSGALGPARRRAPLRSRWSARRRHAERRRQLERGYRSGLLAGARGILCRRRCQRSRSRAPRSGFQTSIAVKSFLAAYVAVQALNSAGAAIGTSPTVKS